MDETYISRREFEEYSKRMEDEHTRQNHRLYELEEVSKENNKLLLSVEKLATNVENMQKSIDGLKSDLDDVKERDGKKWREVVKLVITLVVGGVVGFLLKQLGL